MCIRDRFINKPRTVGTVADLSDYHVEFPKVGGWLVMKDEPELQALVSGKAVYKNKYYWAKTLS